MKNLKNFFIIDKLFKFIDSTISPASFKINYEDNILIEWSGKNNPSIDIYDNGSMYFHCFDNNGNDIEHVYLLNEDGLNDFINFINKIKMRIQWN